MTRLFGCGTRRGGFEAWERPATTGEFGYDRETTGMKRTAQPASPEPPSKQVAGFIAKLEPGVAEVLRASRAALRKRFPWAIELVYDNYNFFVIGFSSTELTSDCMFSLAANAKGVGLHFYYGAMLPDPGGILLGSGTQNRFIRLENAGTLARPEVSALIDAAAAQSETPPAGRVRGYTVIKSVSVKQRPRRLAANK